MLECDVCGAKVGEVRRGRCWECYRRWANARPVGLGACCVICGERRRRVLRPVELLGAWHPMCFNCNGQTLALDPMPPSLVEIRAALERERRDGRPDTRIFQYERRVSERRTDRDDSLDPIDDLSIVVESDEAEELTGIHALPG